MPQILPAVAFAAFNAGVPLVAVNAIVGIGVAGVVLHTAVSTAITIGASYAIAKLTAPAIPKPSAGSVEFKQPVPARFFTYGAVKISGPLLLLEVYPAGSGAHLNKITAFGTREIITIQKFYIDGVEHPLTVVSPGVYTTGNIFVSSGSHGFIKVHGGDAAQVVDPHADSHMPFWTTAHRLRSIPYAYAQLWTNGDSGEPTAVDFQNVFPNGAPEVSIVGGVSVYDPRKDTTVGGNGTHRFGTESTWEYSDNVALCVLDWLKSSYGYEKPSTRFDFLSFRQAANTCDEAVPLKAGGTERRYRVATRVGLDEPRSRVLHRLLQAADMQLYTNAAGLIAIRGGKWTAPTVSVQVEETMTEAFFTHGVPMMERVNEYQLTAMLPSHGYTEVELEPYRYTGDPQAGPSDVTRRQALDLSQVPSNSQAQRLAKIYMSKRNPRWTGQVKTNFGGLDVIGEALVSLTFAELDVPPGIFNGPYYIDGQISFLPDRTGLTFPVAWADPAAYSWNEATEEKPAPPVPA